MGGEEGSRKLHFAICLSLIIATPLPLRLILPEVTPDQPSDQPAMTPDAAETARERGDSRWVGRGGE